MEIGVRVMRESPESPAQMYCCHGQRFRSQHPQHPF